MLQGLATRLGAKHPGFEMTAMEIIDATLRASGWPDAETVLRERWIDGALPFEEAHFLTGFPHAGQAVPFRAGLGGARAITRVHAAPAGPHGERSTRPAPEHPFRLMTVAGAQLPQHQLHRDASPAASAKAGRRCMLHADDAARLGIADGDKVRLGNARGEVVLHARIADGLQPGVLVSESIWPSEAFEGGIGINALTSDDPGPPGGGAVFHDTAVWLRPVAAE